MPFQFSASDNTGSSTVKSCARRAIYELSGFFAIYETKTLVSAHSSGHFCPKHRANAGRQASGPGCSCVRQRNRPAPNLNHAAADKYLPAAIDPQAEIANATDVSALLDAVFKWQCGMRADEPSTQIGRSRPRARIFNDGAVLHEEKARQQLAVPSRCEYVGH